MWRLLILLLLLAAPAEAFRLKGAAPPAPITPPSGIPFAALHTYYMSPTGSDAANGLTPATAWATPNHAVVCGDVIIAAAGSYNSRTAMGGGTVSNCPSTAGGIDGAGGIYFAVVLCGGADLEACTWVNNANTNPNTGWSFSNNNWAVEGFKLSFPAGTAYVANACGSGTTRIHHTAFINDISYNTNRGYGMAECALNHNRPGNGADYWAMIGSIAHSSNNDEIGLSAVDPIAPSNWDSAAGTHIYLGGNFVFANLQANGDHSDGEGVMFDTYDAHGYDGLTVLQNNVMYSSAWTNLQIFFQGFNASFGPTIKIINNTSYNGNVGVVWDQCIGTSGDFNFQLDGPQPLSIASYNNIVSTARTSAPAAGCSNYAVVAQLIGGASGPAGRTVTVGGAGIQNVHYNLGAATTAVFNGFSISGPNFTQDPQFKNTAHLLANHVAVPNCSGFDNVAACMGWDNAAQSATANSVIDDLIAQCGANCVGKGYTPPGPCVTSGDVATYYPTWLKGIVYLHWDGASLTQREGLVQKPCGL